MIDDKLLAGIDKALPEFQSNAQGCCYVENGILLMEGLAFCAMVERFNVDLIIESGVAGGGSTELWAKCFTGPIFAIENTGTYGRERFLDTKNRLAKYPNLTLIEGDAFFEIQRVVKAHRDKRIALFVDGPKGRAALAILDKMLHEANVVLAALHDQGKVDSDAYHLMDELDGLLFYTDDEAYASRYLFLDRQQQTAALDEELAKYPRGPGLGVAANLSNGSSGLRDRLRIEFRYRCHQTRSRLSQYRFVSSLTRLVPAP